MFLKRIVLAAALGTALIGTVSAAEAEIPIKDFVRHSEYSAAKISPTGKYLALTALQGKQMVLVVMRLSDMKVLRSTHLDRDESVGAFYWVGPERIVFTGERRIGSYAQPFSTGEWYATDADGSWSRPLITYDTQGVYSHANLVRYSDSFDMLDPLPEDPSTMLMELAGPTIKDRAEVVAVDTTTGRRKTLARAPRGSCQMVLDANRQPRFANCFDSKDDDGSFATHSELYRRDDNDTWTLLSRSKDDKHQINVVGTAKDGRIYAVSNDGKRPRGFGVLDPATSEFKVLFQDTVAEPASYIPSSDGDTVLGVITMAAAPRVELIEKSSPDATLYAGIAKSFPGKLVEFTSATTDGKQIVVSVHNAQDPGELYLYNRDEGSMRFLMRNRSWVDPAKMAEVKPFSFKTRDGMTMYGYLTIPKGGKTKLPTIINPHGGPIGPRDDWGYDWEAQMLASRGYLVVKLNFRGSGGYGMAFQDAGHGEWGEKMQHDLTDVTKWVAEQGYADPDRVCMYGGSYGGYASLMAVAKEPQLYKCAAGYVGVYDLEMMYTKGDIPQRDSGKRFLVKTIGTDKAELKRRSPVALADKIKAPVFLAAGMRDVRAPKEHTEAMRDALKAAGNPPEEVIIEPAEMHGFYEEKARENLYTKLLAFFDRHIGSGAGASAAAGASGQ